MKHQRTHFLGLGGIGMSALAHILLEEGETVSGCDLRPLPLLEKKGARITSSLPPCDRVIFSSAIKEDHPQYLMAQEKKIPLLHRSLLLKELIEAKRGLLVAGTHGKTSTSGLLTWVLTVASRFPSFAVGGILKNLGVNGGAGKGEFFVSEADESDGSFLNYPGVGAIVTNIEVDHLDYWKDRETLLEGFKTFLSRVKQKELLFFCADDPFLSSLSPKGVSYGRKGELKLLAFEQTFKQSVMSVAFEGKIYKDIFMPSMGEPLALNALAVFGLALRLGVDEKTIRAAFQSYQGVKRRLEHLGEKEKVTYIDDYAHHPTEIRVTLESLRKSIGARRLVVLFEPHRYSRTRDHFSEFTKAFQCADLVILTSIYGAGESPIPGVSGEILAKKMQGGPALFFKREELEGLLPKLLIPGDVFVTMGAGSINQLPYQLLENKG